MKYSVYMTPYMTIGFLLSLTLLFAMPQNAGALEQAPQTIMVGDQDLQTVLDAAPPHSTIVANRNRQIVVTQTLLITKPVILVGLNARLKPGLTKTPILEVLAEGVRIRDFHLTGNGDGVVQKGRAPLLVVRRGH